MTMFEQIKAVILDSLSCEPEDITMEARLVEDLEADSLDAVELNMALEEALGYSVADEELQNMKTVGDIVRYLETHQS
ncbi:acyl carrier protein [Intestinimonas butyriciproducens]|nr:acyl carrier protein [Intestinimonas butyriciproducens]MBU5230935.1 acyl carrier protein [Intestinimonas butyriciproducens]MCI6362699.1 acyl carrier protein [Intestinimonas butyriciproducens]MCR1907006.1 acyl carrier protein [Intestinimonas butyriciproducens]MDB7831518.1 acyl carrier protein [Intestinimonas butyriciproducens]MDB7861147.1 acyl carrier protein [Intestinimonas butyriciproducens]